MHFLSLEIMFYVRCRWWCFLHPFRRNKGQIFQPIAQAWHRNLRSDSVLVHTGYIGAILVPGFGTQPYSSVNKNVIMSYILETILTVLFLVRQKYFETKPLQNSCNTVVTLLNYSVFLNKSVEWMINWLTHKTITCSLLNESRVFKQVVWVNDSLTHS